MSSKTGTRPVVITVVAVLWTMVGLDTRADSNLASAIELFRTGHYEEAKGLLRKVVAVDSDNAKVYYYLGRTYFALCEYNKAIKYAKRAAELDSDNAEHYFWLGRSYGAKAVHSSLFKQAVLAPKIRRAFERAVALNAKHAGAQAGLANYYLQAPGFMGGDIDKAFTHARVLIELGEPSGGVLLARIYEKNGESNLAEAEYENAEQSFRGSADDYQLYESYGQFLLKRKHFDEAIAKFQKQLALAPDKAEAHRNLGDAYKAVGRSQDAANEYRQASKLMQICETTEDKPRDGNQKMEQPPA